MGVDVISVLHEICDACDDGCPIHFLLYTIAFFVHQGAEMPGVLDFLRPRYRPGDFDSFYSWTDTGGNNLDPSNHVQATPAAPAWLRLEWSTGGPVVAFYLAPVTVQFAWKPVSIGALLFYFQQNALSRALRHLAIYARPPRISLVTLSAILAMASAYGRWANHSG